MSGHGRQYRELVPLLALMTICLAVGCKVGPNHVPPSPHTPQVWSQPVNQSVVFGSSNVDWWTVFRDPVLDHLIAETASTNLSLREAGLRIVETRFQRNVVRGDLFPDIDGTASYSRNKISGNGNPFGIRNTGGFNISQPFNLYSAGFDASWELDVFGRLRRAVEAADAEIDIATEDHNALYVTLLAEVAATYVELRTTQEQLAIAERNVHIQRKTLKLADERFRTGTVSKLDVAQATTNLRNTEATIPRLRSKLRKANNRLCVLRAQYPHDLFHELGGSRSIPLPPPEVVVGLPADLILQRPDVRQAERQVAAQSARVGVAVSDLYPQFSLTGVLTVDAVELTDLFKSESIAHRLVGPSIRWNILNFGRIRNNIRVQDTRLQQAAIRYEQTLLRAFEEVENALTEYLEEQQRARTLLEAAEAAREAERLARERYLKGKTDFQSVLDAQRFLLLVEEQTAGTKGNVSRSLIALYKALGGGWQCGLPPRHEVPGPEEIPQGQPNPENTMPQSWNTQNFPAVR